MQRPHKPDWHPSIGSKGTVCLATPPPSTGRPKTCGQIAPRILHIRRVPPRGLCVGECIHVSTTRPCGAIPVRGVRQEEPRKGIAGTFETPSPVHLKRSALKGNHCQPPSPSHPARHASHALAPHGQHVGAPRVFIHCRGRSRVVITWDGRGIGFLPSG
jgi:hypothetical protein